MALWVKCLPFKPEDVGSSLSLVYHMKAGATNAPVILVLKRPRQEARQSLLGG